MFVHVKTFVFEVWRESLMFFYHWLNLIQFWLWFECWFSECYESWSNGFGTRHCSVVLKLCLHPFCECAVEAGQHIVGGVIIIHTLENIVVVNVFKP